MKQLFKRNYHAVVNRGSIIDKTEDDHKVLLFNFFMWFRENGGKYVNISIEKMIEIYLKSCNNQ